MHFIRFQLFHWANFISEIFLSVIHSSHISLYIHNKSLWTVCPPMSVLAHSHPLLSPHECSPSTRFIILNLCYVVIIYLVRSKDINTFKSIHTPLVSLQIESSLSNSQYLFCLPEIYIHKSDYIPSTGSRDIYFVSITKLLLLH